MERLKAWVNLPALAAAILSGSTYVVIKVALQEFTPLSYAAGRLILGTLVMVGIMVMTEKNPRIGRKDVPLLAVTGLIGLGAFQIFYVESLRYTTASNTSLLIATSPILAALTVAAVGLEKLPARRIMGILLGFAGAALVIQAGGLQLGERLLGDLLGLGASLSWAWYALFAVPLLKKHSSIKVTAYAMVAGTLIVVPFSAPELLATNWASLSLVSWLALLYGAIFGLVLGFILWYQGIRELGPTRTLVYLYLTPVCAIISSAIFLRETLAPIQLIGALVAFAGIGLARR